MKECDGCDGECVSKSVYVYIYAYIYTYTFNFVPLDVGLHKELPRRSRGVGGIPKGIQYIYMYIYIHI